MQDPKELIHRSYCLPCSEAFGYVVNIFLYFLSHYKTAPLRNRCLNLCQITTCLSLSHYKTAPLRNRCFACCEAFGYVVNLLLIPITLQNSSTPELLPEIMAGHDLFTINWSWPYTILDGFCSVLCKSKTRFLAFDLRPWPTIPLANVKVDPHAKNQGRRSNSSARRVQTDKQTDGRTDRLYQVHYLSHFAVDNLLVPMWYCF